MKQNSGILQVPPPGGLPPAGRGLTHGSGVLGLELWDPRTQAKGGPSSTFQQHKARRIRGPKSICSKQPGRVLEVAGT